MAEYLLGEGGANFEVRADRNEERPLQSQTEHRFLPTSSEQAKVSGPILDRVSTKDPSISGQSLQTIKYIRVPEEVPFDDPWNGLATPQTREPQLDVSNSSVVGLNAISTVPLALKVSQEQNAIEDMSCLLEQQSIDDQLTLNAFENEKSRCFRHPLSNTPANQSKCHWNILIGIGGNLHNSTLKHDEQG